MPHSRGRGRNSNTKTGTTMTHAAKITRQREMLKGLLVAQESGITTVWYGNIENAEPVDIEEAINDIAKMDDDAIGDAIWGEWPDEEWPEEEYIGSR